MQSVQQAWELILVVDGSKDHSYSRLAELAIKDTEHIHVIELRRNFGQTAAKAAENDHAKGEVMI